MTVQVLQVKVKPNAQASSFGQSSEGMWLAQIKSPPVDGKANQELITLVAEHFQCAKSAVSIKTGAPGRLKLVHPALSIFLRQNAA
jgi:uncharacterized protein (TIGR00251 family)